MIRSLAGAPCSRCRDTGEGRVLAARRLLGAVFPGLSAVLGLIPGRRAAGGSAAYALMAAARMGQCARAIARGPADDDQAGSPGMTCRALCGIGPPLRTRRLTHRPSRTQVRF